MVNKSLLLAGVALEARGSGALWWAGERVLVAGDLHLGRSERIARGGLTLLPPYETTDTLDRLEAEVAALRPRTVICLGDSFDDLAAANGLADAVSERLTRLTAGRAWIWVAGNHDPGPADLPGTWRAAVGIGPLDFRHIAEPGLPPGRGEVSAHYHPKAELRRRGQRIARRCFLAGGGRVILPAFGTYTGGLDVRDAAFDPLFDGAAEALMLGSRVTAVRRDRLG